MTHVRALVVTAHFHRPEAVLELALSLTAQRERDWRLVIVDNGSNPAGCRTLEAIASRDARITLIESPRNLGYFGGVRVGMRAAQGEDGLSFDWLMVVNQDVVLAPDFLTVLVKQDPDERANSVLAPRIMAEPSGAELNPFLSTRPSMTRTLIRAIAFSTLTAARLSVAVSQRRPPRAVSAGSFADEERPIYAPHGSLAILSSRFFEVGGHLGWRAFMFGEELFIAEQARQLNLGVRFLPQLQAVHIEHSSTSAGGKTILRYKRQGIVRSSLLLMSGSLRLRAIHRWLLRSAEMPKT